MPWVGFVPTITASERAETVHALERSATLTGSYLFYYTQLVYHQGMILT
jgi:hypothetical protein